MRYVCTARWQHHSYDYFTISHLSCAGNGSRYGRRYQDMLRGWEEQRAASAAAFATKSRLAYEAAGGEALCKRMEEQVGSALSEDQKL
jgi:hypothetical protein